MKNNRIVVALGRNAFGETFPEQQKNVKKAAEAIADHFGRVVECFVKRIHANLRNHSGNRFENAAVQKL